MCVCQGSSDVAILFTPYLGTSRDNAWPGPSDSSCGGIQAVVSVISPSPGNSYPATQSWTQTAEAPITMTTDLRALLLRGVLPADSHRYGVISHVTMGTAKPPDASPELVQKAELANNLAIMSQNNQPVVEHLPA
ncbi:hypothetical protein EDB80DRAFT_783909 [Ilyonectria destructans]|nr:hypothetical protein EDB80DRAFT_783909 [Ilyonectria destructans]